MKKFIVVILALALIASLFACATAEEKPLSVVTTIFPIYDWVREAAGGDEAVEITMLLDSGVDLHSFQPTAADIMKIATCDVFIYVGGESDEWVEDALREAVNPEMKVVNLLETLGDDVKEEEIVEGMEAEEEDEDEVEGEVEYDEHVWLSLRNAKKLVAAIAGTLGEVAPEKAESYAASCEAYTAKLDALDAAYAGAVEGAAVDTVLFGDRFPFRYLVDDYGLNYYAAFVGCSAESEASFETVVFLSGKVDELGLPAVLTIEGDNHRIAETIVANTQAKSAAILTMDSMQATTAEDVKNGVTYLGVMEANLDTLRQALNG
ncbi:MAG: zinc ABC transporter substrate-binding protein [Clostridia bacterium]|nr:zinc ABC transporter substrate-binding protein [Clostridia bacterium]